jgi:hypothetical protein
MPTKQVHIVGLMTWEDSYPSHGPGFPTPPIYLPPTWGGQPPTIWPSPGHPAHPIAPGGPPPGIWPSPGHPAHPIAPGGPPPGVWVPGFPDQGLPVPPGIWPSPGVPTHPIAPGGPPPTAGWVPPGTGPSHPISGGGYVVGWSPTYGFVFIPLGGAQPPTSGGETPTHPIAGTDTKPDQGLP